MTVLRLPIWHCTDYIFVQILEPPSADKETQTDPADFKLVNGQTVQLMNDNENKPPQQTTESKPTSNNIKTINTNDKSSSTPVTNDKADTL